MEKMAKNETFIVKKSVPLKGSVTVSGSKNAALPILAATLLTEGKTVLKNIPDLTDIAAMCEILRCLGAKVRKEGHTVFTDTTHLANTALPYELTSRMRGSFLVMGPLLSRLGSVRLSLPGGCPIGSRPVDLHLKGFAALGAEVKKGYGFAEVSAKRLSGQKIYLDFPSVGATENILMAAVLSKGVTTIENAAAEPEIADLAAFLNAMGACVSGAGTDTVTVRGVSSLKNASYSIMPDRIEAGTLAVAAAITGGSVTLENVIASHLKPLTAKLTEMGFLITTTENTLKISEGKRRLSADIKTLPFPGFPTDMQAQMMALLSLTEGTGIVTETVFENRFLHTQELCRMGASIKVEGRCAVIEGCKRLTGTKVCATDLRAGASLVLAGLAAEGKTEVHNVFHIDRGYEHLETKLNSLGAEIMRI